MFTKKITDEYIPIICNLHIRGYTPIQITRILNDKGLDIGRPAIHLWINNPINQIHIDKAKVAYRNDPEAVDIAHKRHRLDDLNTARDAIVKTLKTMITGEGTIYEKKINKFVTLARRLAELNIAARDEMEKKPEMVGRKVLLLDIPKEAIISELASIDRELGIKSKGNTGETADSLKAGTQTP